MLIRELEKEDDFITVRLDGKEYIIESIGRVFICGDYPASHRCLDIRDGGDGNILR